MSNEVFFDIHSMGEGVLQDLFDKELNRVLKNINDVNTDPEQKRSITVKINFLPNKTRSAAIVKVECIPKLATDSKFETQIAIGLDNGLVKAKELDAKQLSLFTDAKQNLRRMK